MGVLLRVDRPGVERAEGLLKRGADPRQGDRRGRPGWEAPLPYPLMGLQHVWEEGGLPAPCSPLPGAWQGPQRPLAGTGLVWRGCLQTFAEVNRKGCKAEGRGAEWEGGGGRLEPRSLKYVNAFWAQSQVFELPMRWILCLGRLGTSRFLQTEPTPCSPPKNRCPF